MQIQLSEHELHVLANTLARHNRDLEYEIAQTDDREFKHMLQATLELLTAVQNHLTSGEAKLSFEEARALTEALERSERALSVEIAHTDNRAFKHMLHDNLDEIMGAHYKISGTIGRA
ncbi:MAG TPA: hypothetical protein VF786_05180 [Terriglobales bacterium]